MAEAKTNRRLAAVLAADVVGYSRMMSRDEAGTLAALKRYREGLFDPAVAEHGGRIVKLMGDGTLVEFGSVVDAVSCAVAIQSAPSRAPANDAITLRIGINLGDVIIEGDDIYGDGVNVAARLEPLAEPGGICIASIVRESIGNRVDAAFSDGGDVTVKNIERPIHIWHWRSQSGSAPTRPSPIAPASPTASVAVLPFDNMSGDPEQEYFSDGITEDIITDLSKVSGLMVIARNSSFAYKRKSVDVRAVGRDLGVMAVLEGSIRRVGSRVRINAQLIDAVTGGHLWAERYDRELTDIFAVQDEVTKQIVEALKVKLTRGEAARIAGAPTTSLEAHDLVLRGRALMAPNMDGKVYVRATEFFTRAIALDRRYSQAYALLAAAHMLNFINRWSDDADTSVRVADELSDKAIVADANEPTGHLMASWVAMIHKDFERARTTTDKALQLDPNSAFALNSRGTLAIYLGHPEEAIQPLERAMQLDPETRQQYLHFLGVAHLLLGHNETAAAIFRERVLLVPQSDFSRSMLSAALGHLGQVDEAHRVWAELKKINPRYSFAEHMGRMPFRDPATAEKIIEGLARAGLPD